MKKSSSIVRCLNAFLLASVGLGCGSAQTNGRKSTSLGQENDAVDIKVSLQPRQLGLAAAVVNSSVLSLTCDGIGPITLPKSIFQIPLNSTNCLVKLLSMRVDDQDYSVDAGDPFVTFQKNDQAKFVSSAGGVLFANVVEQLPAKIEASVSASYSFSRFKELSSINAGTGVVSSAISVAGQNPPSYGLNVAISIDGTASAAYIVKAVCNTKVTGTTIADGSCDGDPVRMVKVGFVDYPATAPDLAFLLSVAGSAMTTVELKGSLFADANGGFQVSFPATDAKAKLLFLANADSSAFLFAKITNSIPPLPSPRTGILVLNNATAFDNSKTINGEVFTLSEGIKDLAGFATSSATSGSAFSDAIKTQRAVIIPEAELASFDTLLDVSARASLKDYVINGGKLVVILDGGTFNTRLLNNVFSWSLSQAPSTSSGSFPAVKAAPFMSSGAPLALPGLNAVYPIVTSSLPAGALSLYASSTNTVAFHVPMGTGSILVLSYDWFDAKPFGSQASDGWLALLRAAIQ